MRARAVAAIVLAAVVGAGAYAAWRFRPKARLTSDSGKQLVVHAVARTQDLLVTVDATGALVARDSTPVVPEISGEIVSVCENGILVSAGDEIMVLDLTQTQKQVEDLTDEWMDAQRKLGQAKQRGESRLAGMNLKLERARDAAAAFERQQQATLEGDAERISFSQAELERLRTEVEVKQRLAARGLIAGSEVEREQAGFKAAEFGLQRDRTTYELGKSQVEAQILNQRKQVADAEHDLAVAAREAQRDERMAQNRSESIRLRLDRAKEDLLKVQVTAPARGLVALSMQGRRGDEGLPQQGDSVYQGRQVAEIVDLGHMQMKLELDQQFASAVKVGQHAMVDIDALPGKIIPGEVQEIGATARRPPVEGWRGLSTETTFPVTIDLPPTPDTLMRPGMRANARIVTRRVSDALTVPAECVFVRDGQSVVFAERGGQYVRTAVQLGDSNGDFVQVTGGLKDGDRVALNDLEASLTGGTAGGQATATANGGRPR
jgi:multidrug resistance efflux pump